MDKQSESLAVAVVLSVLVVILHIWLLTATVVVYLGYQYAMRTDILDRAKERIKPNRRAGQSGRSL